MRRSTSKHWCSPYTFATPLYRGVVVGRPNRFVMRVVDIRPSTAVLKRNSRPSGEAPEQCHCPVTGAIMNLDFNLPVSPAVPGVPCLLHPTLGRHAKSRFTVEAVSLFEAKGEPQWLGINQNRSNRYVEHFLRAGALSEVMGLPKPASPSGELQVLPEQRLGESKIDFLVEGRHFVEVKTPLSWLDPEGHPRRVEASRQAWNASRLSPRLDRHHNSLAAALRKEGRDGVTAAVIIVFLGDTEPFSRRKSTASRPSRRAKRKIGERDSGEAPATPSPKRLKAVLRPPEELDNKVTKAFRERLKEVQTAVGAAEDAGLKTYQLNLSVGVRDVQIIDFFELERLIPEPEG